MFFTEEEEPPSSSDQSDDYDVNESLSSHELDNMSPTHTRHSETMKELRKKMTKK